MRALQFRVHTWASRTFGADRSQVALLKHLKRECDEAIALIEEEKSGIYGADNDAIRQRIEYLNTHIKSELADCLILLLNISSLRGISVDILNDAAMKKMEINEARKWKAPDSEGVIEHLCDADKSGK